MHPFSKITDQSQHSADLTGWYQFRGNGIGTLTSTQSHQHSLGLLCFAILFILLPLPLSLHKIVKSTAHRLVPGSLYQTPVTSHQNTRLLVPGLQTRPSYIHIIYRSLINSSRWHRYIQKKNQAEGPLSTWSQTPEQWI